MSGLDGAVPGCDAERVLMSPILGGSFYSDIYARASWLPSFLLLKCGENFLAQQDPTVSPRVSLARSCHCHSHLPLILAHVHAPGFTPSEPASHWGVKEARGTRLQLNHEVMECVAMRRWGLVGHGFPHLPHRFLLAANPCW